MVNATGLAGGRAGFAQLRWTALQLDAAELCQNLGCSGAGLAVAVLGALFLAFLLRCEHLCGSLFAHQLLCGAFGEGDYAIDGGGAAFQRVKKCGNGRVGGCVVGGNGIKPSLCGILGYLRACIGLSKDLCSRNRKALFP